MKYLRYIIVIFFFSTVYPAYAALPTALTDKIRSGSGIIDIFKDASGTEVQEYFQGQGGTFYLGVDLNEDASGNESSTSAGVAIKEMELLIQTTNGDFSFSEFYTNTTATILEEGAAGTQEFHTLFGTSGSNQITGSTSNFDIAAFDDVIEIRNVNVTGDITGAQLRVKFLDTARVGTNETFFDYSAGFEEFAVLTSSDARLLDTANLGLGDAAPETVTYNISAPSGTPEPYWFLLLIIPVIFLWRKHGRKKAHI